MNIDPPDREAETDHGASDAFFGFCVFIFGLAFSLGCLWVLVKIIKLFWGS